MNEKVYIELTNVLPERYKIEKAIAVCFFKDDIVIVDSHTNGMKFPTVQLEQSEAPERTVRREVYSLTGALLRETVLLGVMHVLTDGKKESVAVYVGDVVALEDTPLIPANYHRSLMNTEDVYRWLSRSQYEPVRDYLLYHAYEKFKRIREK